MDTENTGTEIDKRKAFIDSVMERLRKHYADRTPLPGNEEETLTLPMLQRLYRHVMSEGYGE